jgi:hypothetical protein
MWAARGLVQLHGTTLRMIGFNRSMLQASNAQSVTALVAKGDALIFDGYKKDCGQQAKLSRRKQKQHQRLCICHKSLSLLSALSVLIVHNFCLNFQQRALPANPHG